MRPWGGSRHAMLQVRDQAPARPPFRETRRRTGLAPSSTTCRAFDRSGMGRRRPSGPTPPRRQPVPAFDGVRRDRRRGHGWRPPCAIHDIRVGDDMQVGDEHGQSFAQAVPDRCATGRRRVTETAPQPPIGTGPHLLVRPRARTVRTNEEAGTDTCLATKVRTCRRWTNGRGTAGCGRRSRDRTGTDRRDGWPHRCAARKGDGRNGNEGNRGEPGGRLGRVRTGPPPPHAAGRKPCGRRSPTRSGERVARR